jgi:hypothetical protein
VLAVTQDQITLIFIPLGLNEADMFEFSSILIY